MKKWIEKKYFDITPPTIVQCRNDIDVFVGFVANETTNCKQNKKYDTNKKIRESEENDPVKQF